jgi:SAM-dependent methyltransferase
LTDFVFRDRGDGSLEFVGDFDGLYLSETDPWGQSGADGRLSAYYDIARRRLVETLDHLVTTSSTGLEVGCGHGHVTDLLSEMLPHIVWEGLDISPAAIETAKQKYQHINFYCGDFANHTFGPKHTDIVILNQMLWYVLHRIDDVVAHACKVLPEGGLLVVAQAYLAEPQRYGSDIINGFAGTVALFSERYSDFLELIDAQYEEIEGIGRNDGLLVYRKK